MDTELTTCRIQVKWQSGEAPEEYSIQSLKDTKGLPDVTEKLRQQWIEGIVNSFSSGPSSVANIRPWDILLHQDGSVELLSSEKGGRSFYPSRFRIPACNVRGLDDAEKVKRAEKFALGSLLYQVVTTNQPFDELSDDEVQDHYSRGDFPDDVFSLAMGPYILGCWSLEFEKEMERLRKYSFFFFQLFEQYSFFLVAESSKASMGARFSAYAKAHPFLLASQIAGGVVMTASVAALPILGAAGFAATGPIAGSAAAAWQSSVGLVQAGSLFAWCQSAAMGGAAVNGIIACGAAGGSAALAATGASVAGGQTRLTPEKLKEMFLMVYRKENSGSELICSAEN